MYDIVLTELIFLLVNFVLFQVMKNFQSFEQLLTNILKIK